MTHHIDTHLLVIANRYPHLYDSISSSFVKYQIDYLKKYFNKIYVISLNPFMPKFLSKFPFINPIWKKDAFASDYKYDNVEVFFSKSFTLPVESSRKKKGDVAFKDVNKIIQQEKIEFDLIHSHFTWSAGYVGAKLKEKYNVPFIVTAHGYDIYDLPFKDEEWSERIKYVLNTANHIITVSNSNLKYINKLNVKTPVTVIPNGFRSDLFYPMNSEKCRKILNLPFDKKLILSVGNLLDIKGHQYLIEAMHEVSTHRDDFFCVIVGSGKIKNKLDNQIKKLEIENYVKLVGEKDHNEIPLWMNACDLFVLPSIRESFGIVQIEAMACGKPVVATYNGGSEEIITSEKFGYLVAHGDPHALSENILIALEKEWNNEISIENAKQYSWDKIVNNMIKIYDGYI